MFKPLAFTKTFAMAAGALIAITVIPSLMGFFVRGKTPTEGRNPVNRFCIWVYMPFIRFALRHKLFSMGIAFLLLAVTIVPWTKIGSELMPPLREGDILFMPTTVPGISVTEARRTLQIQDQLLAQFPEVKVVLGKIGRSTTPTDPAPLSMVETHASLRPGEDWPKRLLKKGYLKELAAKMLAELAESGELRAESQSGGKALAGGVDIEQIAVRVEQMARPELNREIRLELVAGLNEGMRKMHYEFERRRDGIRQRIANGEQFDDNPVRLSTHRPSLSALEQLEDQWSAELLQHEMRRIRSELPKRIVDRLVSHLHNLLVENGTLLSSASSGSSLSALRSSAAFSRMTFRL